MKKAEISFEFYFNTFNCGKQGELDRDSFERYIIRAERELESYCSKSVVSSENAEAFMLCACEVAEALFAAEKAGAVKSETIDGYSVTFADCEDSAKKIRKIILRCLGPSGLLFAGVE